MSAYFQNQGSQCTLETLEKQKGTNALVEAWRAVMNRGSSAIACLLLSYESIWAMTEEIFEKRLDLNSQNL